MQNLYQQQLGLMLQNQMGNMGNMGNYQDYYEQAKFIEYLGLVEQLKQLNHLNQINPSNNEVNANIIKTMMSIQSIQNNMNNMNTMQMQNPFYFQNMGNMSNMSNMGNLFNPQNYSLGPKNNTPTYFTANQFSTGSNAPKSITNNYNIVNDNIITAKTKDELVTILKSIDKRKKSPESDTTLEDILENFNDQAKAEIVNKTEDN